MSLLLILYGFEIYRIRSLPVLTQHNPTLKHSNTILTCAKHPNKCHPEHRMKHFPTNCSTFQHCNKYDFGTHQNIQQSTNKALTRLRKVILGTYQLPTKLPTKSSNEPLTGLRKVYLQAPTKLPTKALTKATNEVPTKRPTKALTTSLYKLPANNSNKDSNEYLSNKHSYRWALTRCPLQRIQKHSSNLPLRLQQDF